MPTPNIGYLSATQTERFSTSVRWLDDPVRSAAELKIVPRRLEKPPGANTTNKITANTSAPVVVTRFFLPNLRTSMKDAATRPIKPPREKVTTTPATINPVSPKYASLLNGLRPLNPK